MLGQIGKLRIGQLFEEYAHLTDVSGQLLKIRIVLTTLAYKNASRSSAMNRCLYHSK